PSSSSLRPWLPPIHTPSPYTTLFRSARPRLLPHRPLRSRLCHATDQRPAHRGAHRGLAARRVPAHGGASAHRDRGQCARHGGRQDRKSTRLNSSHVKISYAVFCLKKK